MKNPFWEDAKPEKPRRSRGLPKSQWEALKKQFGNKCALCKEPERRVPLQQAHPKAQSKGGQMIWPMCANCHARFDKGMLTRREVLKLGISWPTYQNWIPKKPKKKNWKKEKAWYEL
jgi:hypothetical protein